MAEKDIEFVPELPSFRAPASKTPRPTPLDWPVVDVGMSLFVIRAKYWDPVTEADKTLPPHVWALGASGAEADVVGPPSNDKGVAVVPLGDEVGRKKALKWSLILIPYPAKEPDKFDDWKAAYAKDGEVWIDLDKNEWVFAKDVKKLEKRRLLRWPIWTSSLKAKSGGFKEAPPTAPNFKATGVFSGAEILAYGTKKSPWEMQLDHDWYRSYVRFKYYDLQRKKEQLGAPGLVVEARAGKKRVGAGTSLDETGLAYVLHARAKNDSKDAHYAFVTEDATVIEFGPEPAAAGSKPEKDTRMVHPNPISIDPKKKRARHRLPVEWHSDGMEARHGAAARRTWTADLQAVPPALTKTDPLVFHLDDTVLMRVDHATPELVSPPVDARLTLFDHWMKIKAPDPLAPHQWIQTSKRDLLRAEEAIFVDGKGLDDVTLAIAHEGTVHVLGESHVRTGTHGKYVGARAAVHGNALHANFNAGCPYLPPSSGTYELHLIPDAIEDTWDGVAVELCHLLVFVPMSVTARVGGTPANVSAFFVALVNASKRWDQLHAAHPGTAYTKDYRGVPKGGPAAGDRVVRLRHFFSTRTDGAEKFKVQVGTPPDAALAAQGRSYVQGDTLYMIPTAMSSIATDKAKDSDNVEMDWYTLAHELGHVIGLPDEYVENVAPASAPASAYEPRLPQFKQSSEGKPFNFDRKGMMKGNKLPRLRYQWHHLRYLNVNANAANALHRGADYVTTYKQFLGGTTHVIPERNSKHPWDVAAGPTSFQKTDLILYRLGDDEGSREAMFGRLATSIDGLLLLRTKFWFDFITEQAYLMQTGASMVDVLRASTVDFANDVARFDVMAQFHQRFFDGGGLPSIRVRSGLAGSRLENVAIVFQPHFEFGPAPQKGATSGEANVIVRVVKDSVAHPIPSELVAGASGNIVRTGIGSVGWSLQRFALGLPAAAAGVPLNGPITFLELAPVVVKLASMLGDGAARSVLPLV